MPFPGFRLRPRTQPGGSTLALIALAVVAIAGCGQVGPTPRLVGVWVGQPETAEQRAERAPKAEAAADNDTGANAEGGSEAKPASSVVEAGPEPPAVRTDLEAIDIRVTLDFGATGGVAMWLGDGGEAAPDEKLNGAWRVVSAERNRLLVEITAERPDVSGDATKEKRRFTLTLLNGDSAFTLVEENADRGFGAMYFRRQE